MSKVLYEHPLNEKVRTYLRFEHCLHQLDMGLESATATGYYPFFGALFECFDVIDRSDIKNELHKELELIQENLTLWATYPNVDVDALENTRNKIQDTNGHLPAAYQQLQHLKEDPFLYALRQRFSISGGNCSYDLPSLHYWRQLPDKVRADTVEQWILPIRHYQVALGSVMQFLRERDGFHDTKAESGMFADSADKIELLRIKMPDDANCFPSISGNKFRFAIRFMNLSVDNNKNFVEEDIPFLLSRC